MGSCEFLNHHKHDIDFLHSNTLESQPKNEKSIVDLDLPDWLNEDFSSERKKEEIKVQMETRKKELANRKMEFEKIKKNKGFVKVSDQKLNYPAKKKGESKDNEENMILNYESQDEETENIDEIFKRLKQKNNEENCKENKEKNNNDLSYFPLKVLSYRE